MICKSFYRISWLGPQTGCYKRMSCDYISLCQEPGSFQNNCFIKCLTYWCVCVCVCCVCVCAFLCVCVLWCVVCVCVRFCVTVSVCVPVLDKYRELSNSHSLNMHFHLGAFSC